jgi:hypothetical protein
MEQEQQKDGGGPVLDVRRGEARFVQSMAASASWGETRATSVDGAA